MVRSSEQNLAILKVKSRYDSLLEEDNLILSAAEEGILFEVGDGLDVVVITGHDEHCAFLYLSTCILLSE